MKYQALKQLKTKNKVLGVYDNFYQACRVISDKGGKFQELSYIGGFPIFKDIKNNVYSIQGLNEHYNIVCSINKDDLKNLPN